MNLHLISVHIRARVRRLRAETARDAGYSTETVIVTALLVIMGIAVVGVIASKVLAKANGIDLG